MVTLVLKERLESTERSSLLMDFRPSRALTAPLDRWDLPDPLETRDLRDPEEPPETPESTDVVENLVGYETHTVLRNSIQ